MPAEYEFDRTRNAIGADRIDDSERRTMLEKFKSAGGQVLSEKELRRQQAEKESLSKGRGGSASKRPMLPSEIEREKRRKEAARKDAQSKDAERAVKNYSGFFTVLFIKLRAAMNGVAPFGGKEVNPAFMSALAIDLKQALVELNLVGNDLFLQNPAIGKKIVVALDSTNPLLMETLEYSHRLYNAELYNRLLDTYAGNPNIPVPFSRIDQPLKAVFKQLYILYPFQGTLRKAFETASSVYTANVTNQEQVAAFEQKKKRLSRDLRTIFQVIFPKMMLLIQRMDGVEYPPFSGLLEKAIDLRLDEKLGQRKKGQETSYDAAHSKTAEDKTAAANSSSEGNQAEEKEEEDNPILNTREYQYGKGIMDAMAPPRLKEKYDPQKKINFIQLNDKVYLAYLFFQEFDYEYSFVLTTNKIKINVDYSAGVKVDHKKELTDIYDEARGIFRAFEKYTESVLEYEKLKKNKMSSNYIEQSKLETKALGRVDIEARNTRALIRNFMDKVTKALGKLIADMKGEKLIIGNMDETIVFDAAMERKKRLNGKPVQNCILEAYSYALALRERLSTGDLFGGHIQMTPEEMIKSFGNTYDTGNPES